MNQAALSNKDDISINLGVNSTPKAERALRELAEALQIPDAHFDKANRAFMSVSRWLTRLKSSLARRCPHISLQGSFRHGTVIRPCNDEDDYDVDIVCTCNFSKIEVSQKELKELLGAELKSYAKAHGMRPPDEGNRCWTLEYADGERFHLDCLPAIPDSQYAVSLREQHRKDLSYVDTTLSITDRRHPNFKKRAPDWLLSNPEGYADWFSSRMALAYKSRAEAIALSEHLKVEDIPHYRVKTPLQLVIQILKRHRDIHFADNLDVKPISIIITTLAAHAYDNETQLVAALISIVEKMPRYIEDREGIKWIANPSNPLENFADRWKLEQSKKDAFYSWHIALKQDLVLLLQQHQQSDIDEAITTKFGQSISRRITESRSKNPVSRLGLFRRLNPKHRQQPPWSVNQTGKVEIAEAKASHNGFRTMQYPDGGKALLKESDLVFKAKTTVPRPFKVYWQVVNWGEEAVSKGALRGGFDDGGVSIGNLTRRETAMYTGHHTIECFIVKDGYLAARSGQFEVNVK